MSELVECSFLVPLRGDKALSDGSVHSTSTWLWLKEELDERFGGATQAPGVYKGFYRDPDTGEKVQDDSKRFVVALPRKRLKTLRELLREAAGRFRQKCIYLSVAGRVHFIRKNP